MIRRATSQDYPAIYAIEKACFEDPIPNYEMLPVLQEGNTWVVEEDGKIVGCLMAAYTYAVQIYSIAILPEFQKKGFGWDLLSAFQDFYKGYGLTYLHVDKTNPAQNLYQKFGYKVVDEAIDYYGPGKDAWYMVKYL
jgi:ribosomal protein S18 acetylase RimI-like enzyme